MQVFAFDSETSSDTDAVCRQYAVPARPPATDYAQLVARKRGADREASSMAGDDGWPCDSNEPRMAVCEIWPAHRAGGVDEVRDHGETCGRPTGRVDRRCGLLRGRLPPEGRVRSTGLLGGHPVAADRPHADVFP